MFSFGLTNPKNNLINFKSALIIVAIVTIFFISIISHIQFERLVDANKWVAHTYKVIETTDDVLRNMSLTDRQARSYIFLGDVSYKNGIKEYSNQMEKSLAALYALTKDNPTQQTKLHELTATINQRMDSINAMVRYYEQNAINTPVAKEEFKHGIVLSNQVYNIGGQLRKIELRLLQNRNATLDKNVTLNSYMDLIGQTVAIIFLLISFYLFLSELRRSEAAEASTEIIKEQLNTILNSATDMIAALDKDFRYIFFNAAYANEFKFLFNKDVAPGLRIDEVLADQPEACSKLMDSYRQSFEIDKYIKKVEFQTDGRDNIYEVMSNRVCDNRGAVTAVIHVIRNISERVREQKTLADSYRKVNAAMEELKVRNEKTTLLLEMSDVMLACASVVELSKVITTYCGRALNFTSGILYIMPPSKDRLEQTAEWGKVQSTEKNFSTDHCWALRLGRIHYVDDHHTKLLCGHVKADNVKNINYICVPLRAQNDIYGLLYVEMLKQEHENYLSDNERLLVTTFAEVAAISLANVRLRENLRLQSMCDPLTGLYNRRYLGEFLLRQISQSERTHMPIAILMIDLDHFKKINDVYGHDAGDTVLKEFSEILQNNIRPGDLAARYGGEEFIVMLYNMGAKDARKRAEDIRKALPLLKVRHAGEEIGPLTSSVGIAIYPEMGKNSRDLIAAADKALYKAKETGRNRVVLYTDIEREELSETNS